MPKPYSTDLRERALEAVESGASRREVAEIFRVGVSSVIRWCQSWSETGSVASKRSSGSVSPLEEHSDRIPDSGLLRSRRMATGIPGSRSALQRFFDRHNVALKKSPHAQQKQPRRSRPSALDTRATCFHRPAGVYRRERHQHKHGAAQRPLPTRRTTGRVGSTWTLENDHLCCRLAP